MVKKQTSYVSDKVKTALVKTTGQLLAVSKSPDEQLGDFFALVQSRRVYDDGKTFVDLIPRKRSRQIIKEYNLLKKSPDFNLHEFVARHFYEFAPHKKNESKMSPATHPREHVRNLWAQLERRNRKDRGSLIAVPHKYIVPGGRFSEQFYWDTYFIMLGLAADEHWDLIDGMVRNYAYMLRKFGCIPTANRTYFLSRSQPPFFSHMVRLLGTHRGSKRTLIEYLPSMLSEYRFWMKGARQLRDSVSAPARNRVVCMPDGTILNRYYDNKTTPRPESQLEDIETANRTKTANKQKVFLDLRAAAESGWDFSSRWFKNPDNIESIYTTDIVPVDLNCLLYELERTIGDAYSIMKQSILAKKFYRSAERRAEAIRKYCWDDSERFFGDYDFRSGEVTGSLTLAAAFPLYAGIATPEQARMVAERLEKDFLKVGGFSTTRVNNGQQWDAPNGWAPLQWVVIEGLRKYGYYDLANEAKRRWLHSVEYVFSTKHKMIEKYDVENESRVGGGGEYPLQDGFGWTNGVYAALYDEDMHKQ